MKKSTLKNLIYYAKPHSFLAILAIFLALIHVASLILAPVLIGSAIDYINASGQVNLSQVLDYCIYLLLTVNAAAVSSYLSNILSARLAQKVIKTICLDAIKKINSLPISEIDKLSKGELAVRLTTDCERIAEGLTSSITQIFTFIALVAGTLVFMFSLNITMALVIALLTPISVLAAILIAYFSHKMLIKQTAAEGDIAGMTEEYIHASRSLKLYNYEETAKAEFVRHSRGIQNFGGKAVFAASLTNPTTRFINGLVFASVAMVGSYLVLNDTGFSVGMLSMFLAYALQYARPFNEITTAMSEIQGTMVSAKRVFSIINSDIKTTLSFSQNSNLGCIHHCGKDTTKQSNLKTNDGRKIYDSTNNPLAPASFRQINFKGDIQFKNVSFGYDEKMVIDNFSLNIKQGQRIAIIGKSGSGKTTLMNLLMKFYQANSGQILIDGKDIDDINKSILRENIGLILQDSWVFKGSIFENIAFAKSPTANHRPPTVNEVIEASKKARAHDFIVSLENGYDTIIDHDTLSKGQMQLLSIARIFLQTPPIIILDEATSSVDARTDYLIQDALKQITKGHTSIVVAHRLSTIKNSDLIVVLDEGKSIEQGTHNELLALNGAYCEFILNA